MKFELVPVQKKEKRAPLAVRFIAGALFLLMVLLTLACIWAVTTYSNISLEEVLFYLSMPLRGTSKQFTRAIILHVLIPAAGIACLFLLAVLLPRKKELRLVCGNGKSIRLLPLRMKMRFAYPLLALWLAVVLPFGNRLLGIGEFVSSRMHQSHLIEEEYVDPAETKITFPEKKRNLITIYIESAESTNQDIASGGMMDRNYTPEMTDIEQENVSFSQNDLYAGAAVAPACGWTVAGLVAQTAGIPLKFFRYDAKSVDHLGNDLVKFLPGAKMMGDILKEEGYRNLFICGSDFDFGGRRQMYAQHGAYEIYDYYKAIELGWIPEDYVYGWGFEDVKLYQFTKDMLLELEKDDKPFHLGILTVDTHDPGWLCELCPQTTDNIYSRVVRCSSKQVYDFVEWCKQQDFYENTTIVITGDHASMTKSFYEEHADTYDKHNGSDDRLVYNAFVNPAAQPVKEKNRRFTTLDFFPTVLASIGAEIEGERLGLGTNLFSERETLSEEMGYDKLFTELNRKSLFYDNKLLRP